MNKAVLEGLIKKLGSSHAELVASGSIADGDLLEMFPGVDTLAYSPEPGLELTFDSEAGSFKELHVALLEVLPDIEIYTGDFPAPFSGPLNQYLARQALGESLHYTGPIKMPEPIGKIGGSEIFRASGIYGDDIYIYLTYLENMDVMHVTFCLDKPSL